MANPNTYEQDSPELKARSASRLVGSRDGAWDLGRADLLLFVSSESASLALTISWFPSPATSNRT
jgi:hypothetical protein